MVRLRQWKEQDILENTSVPTYSYKLSVADVPRKPSRIFELFLDIIAIDHLLKETVNYVVQRGNHSVALTSNEMRAFIGIMLVSGYCCLPRRRLYWQRQPDVYNELIAGSMRRDRFDDIMKFFHAADNTKMQASDKYAKIRPLLEILNDNFLKYGEVFRPVNVSVDESVISYFGRYPTKQFIRGKPVRRGYKAWLAADPNGYALHVSVYQGKSGDKDKSNITHGLGGRVVLEVLDILQKTSSNKEVLLVF